MGVRTERRHFQTLKELFAFCVQSEYLEASPMAGMEAPSYLDRPRTPECRARRTCRRFSPPATGSRALAGATARSFGCCGQPVSGRTSWSVSASATSTSSAEPFS